MVLRINITSPNFTHVVYLYSTARTWPCRKLEARWKTAAGVNNSAVYVFLANDLWALYRCLFNLFPWLLVEIRILFHSSWCVESEWFVEPGSRLVSY
ncbi:hypothetical protein Zmor_001899 [Zophobas morio]|uniref:Uncharacterized protein n=1 Tax=Zophobas morio TaxID=2755281 RepID=A0AA38MT99_9CUCU|nr:hypothetical protein Zmor_001899 [Zophobas morio]